MNQSSVQPWWEESFLELDTSTFGEVSTYIQEMVDRVPGDARVLDLGCGDGRIALFFAEHGCDVHAIDISSAAIHKLDHRAAERGVRVTSRVGDMADFSFDGDYDVIVAHGSLQLLPRTQWMRLLDDMKRYTAPGGFDIVIVLTDLIPPPPDLAPFCRGLFKRGELRSYYEGWEILSSSSDIKEGQTIKGVRRQLPLDRVIAQRPRNSQ